MTGVPICAQEINQRLSFLLKQIRNSLEQRSRKNQLRHNNARPLKSHGCPHIVSQIIQLYNLGIHQKGEGGEEPLKVGEERRIVKRPLRCRLGRERMSKTFQNTDVYSHHSTIRRVGASG